MVKFPWQRYGKTSNKKCATSFVNLLQNELNRDVACFTIYEKTPCNLIYLLQDCRQVQTSLCSRHSIWNGYGIWAPKIPFPFPFERLPHRLVWTCNLAIQLNLQHFWKTSCTFSVACFTVHVALVMQFYALSQRESELDRIRLLHAYL